MTGVSMVSLGLSSSRSDCLNWLALLKCFLRLLAG